jgi:hypothetical protein
VGLSFQLQPYLFSGSRQEVSVMRSLFRIFSLSLICFLLIASSDVVNRYGYRGRSLAAAQGGSGGNLALGKPASQSSIAFDAPASRAVDGNTSGNWSNNSVTHTNFEHQPWWQVDLGSVQQIGAVILWNRTDCCSERLSNFYVLVSDNPFSSADLTATINQAGVSNYYTADSVGTSKEIGVYRSGRYVRVQLAGDNYLSLAEVEVRGVASGASVVSVKPRIYQSPDPALTLEGVNLPTNLGHSSTVSAADRGYAPGSGSQSKSCLWHSFSNVSGTKTRVTLKFDWTLDASIDLYVEDSRTNASGSYSFRINYSLDNGSTWTDAKSFSKSVSILRGAGPYSDGDSINTYGSESIDLSNPGAIDLTQIRVRDRISASVSLGTPNNGYAITNTTASVSNISLEVETVNCPASVAADRWRGEFYNNINLSGIPTTVRDDDAGFLNFNFGDGAPPAGTCGLTDDFFSARWTRTAYFSRGVYRFTVTADDGVRLYVDGQSKINAWVIQGPTTYTADVFLTTGNHEIKLEYFEYTGGALISLNWTTVVNCIAGVPADRWKGEYYNGATPTGELAMARDDSISGTNFLNLPFGSASPSAACGVGEDNFSARWTRTVVFAAGTYRFIATVDNGVKLYVDGQSKIDQWGNLPPNTYTADVSLSAGPHEIKLEFVEYTGDASVKLFWVDVNCLANVPVGRWKGEYYNGTTIGDFPAMIRDDGASFLNFDFGLGSPSAACGLGVDNFSARWTRTVNFGSGVYRFSVTGDDGVRLYVDGQTKINKWFSQGATTYTADVQLSAGDHEVKLEYFEGGGPGVAILSWTTLASLSCLPEVLIGNTPRTGGGESIATAPVPEAPKRCGQKGSD